MKNSSLVDYTKKSPNNSGKRTHNVDRISPHCVVGQCSVETLGNLFAAKSRQASCNYAIGSDGRVALIVDEDNRSWCTSSAANDQRAITIECASDKTPPYAFNDKVYQKLVDLCVDICKRYGKTKLLWISDKKKALAYNPAPNEMLITVHRWFKNKACPGDWLMARMGTFANEVTSKLENGTKSTENKVTAPKNEAGTKKVNYQVRVTADALNVRAGAGASFKVNTIIVNRGVYTIVEEKAGWGKLKSGAGWINLSYAKRI